MRTPFQPPTFLSHHPSASPSHIHLLIPSFSQPLSSLDASPDPSSVSSLMLCSLFCSSTSFHPLTSSSYTYPYHYLLHCRHLAQQPGITSSHTRGVQLRDSEHQSLDLKMSDIPSNTDRPHGSGVWKSNLGEVQMRGVEEFKEACIQTAQMNRAAYKYVLTQAVLY